MADVFISYKRERRAAARHLAKILEAYGYTVWFDLALVRGHDYEDQIATQLTAAKAVIVLWCTKSVASKGVRSESSRASAAGKLVPLKIEPCELPLFSTNEQHIDLTAATGAPSNLYELHPVLDDVERLVGRAPSPDLRTLREYEATWRSLGALAFAKLPLEVVPIPEAVIGGAGDGVPTGGGASPTHDYGFWERQWDKHGAGENVVALQAIADDAPRIFAAQAKARMAEIEAARERAVREAVRAAREAEAEIARLRAEGRVAVTVRDGTAIKTLWPKPGAGELVQDVVEINGRRIACPELVVVPAGSFLMGSKDGEGDADERPQHKVTIAQPFAVGRTAVTFDEWDAAVAAGGVSHKPSDSGWGRGRRPVINVSWEDATAYCTWLSKVTGQPYRLLSEAEWEYACRAVTSASTPHPKYHFGNDEKQLGVHAWYSANSGGKPHPVGEKAPNAWGLHDMHGNTWDWCTDNWHDSYVGAPSDGSAWISGGDTSLRVVRGGSWYGHPQFLRAASRGRDAVGFRLISFGFRVARPVSSPRTF